MNTKSLGAAVCAGVLLAGCGDYAGGEQVSAARNESAESPNYGSATDIVKSDGTEVNTNNLNVADNGIGGPMQRESGNYQAQPVSGQASDVELAKKIRIALTTGSMGTTGVIAENQLTKIQVQVQDGVATLSGPVGSEGEKQSLEKQVAGMKGVKSVNNQLTVIPGANSRNPIDARSPRTEF
ncbi:MAG TPA: BON domain-containing protein [Candidatus Kapabacteria bacterium]|nr:BON domain-containing protein [Candidatus Kapabacteria bacterium]